MSRNNRGMKPLVAGCSLAMALSAFACNRNNDQVGDEDRARDDNRIATDNRQQDEQQPSMTVVGCLQEGDGRNDFIVTADNTARDVAATTGSAADADRQRLLAAAKSYRLTDADQDLKQYTGKQVRVMGKLVDTANLPSPHATAGPESAPGQAAQTQSGQTARDSERAEIHERDLAKLDVESVEVVSETCGSAKRSDAQPSAPDQKR
jgi:hypothetical protein